MKSTLITTNKRGFTIIETMVVLIVASLIMSIVFIAIPQLQKNQRNHARRQDIRSLIFAVQDCVIANRFASRCRDTSRIRLDPDESFSVFEDYAVSQGGGGGAGGVCGSDSPPVYTAQALKNGGPARSVNNVCDNMPIIWIGKKCEDQVVSAGGIEDSNDAVGFAINFPIEGGKNALTQFLSGYDLIASCMDSTFNNRKG